MEFEIDTRRTFFRINSTVIISQLKKKTLALKKVKLSLISKFYISLHICYSFIICLSIAIRDKKLKTKTANNNLHFSFLFPGTKLNFMFKKVICAIPN